MRPDTIPEKIPRVEAATPNVDGMLRVLLPPNLATAAARNAVAVKIEFAAGTAPAPELLPVLAWLQHQTGAPAGSPLFVQFTRAQLRELILMAEDLPVFFWLNRPADPLVWDNGTLRGASEHLEEPDLPAPPPAPPEKPRRIPRPKPTAPDTVTPAVVDGSEHYLAIALPSREHPTYDAALDLVKSHGFALETSNRKWWLRDRHKTLNFLAANWAALREHYGAQFTPNFEQNTARLQLAEVTCAAAEERDGYDVTLALRAGRASEEAVRAALAGGRGYVEDGGNLVLLPTAIIDRFADVQRRLAGDATASATPRRTIHLTGASVAEADALLESIAPNFQPPAAWRTRSEALRNLSKLQPAPLPPTLDALLRPYQRIGVAWLWHLYRHQLGGVLADEMGLGKTLEALALLAALRAVDPPLPGASLVVCPASLVENWRREAARFTPWLRVVTHHGESRSESTVALSASDLVITSYGTLVRDRALLESMEFICVLADEAQHIKNRRTQNALALRALRARGRFLLTGTPVENSLDDLRSLFDFLMPGYLASPPAGARGDDKAWFDERLRAQTAPYILRRTKTAVVPELPAKIEQTLYCELPPGQAALYRQWQERGEREFDTLAAAGASDARLRLAALTQLLRLRQVCCDPRLLDAPAQNADVASAKLEAFRELLAEAADGGHRLLVFSQFTSLLALLRAELETQNMACCYLDGTMRAHARQAEVDRFQQSPDVPVFLISLRAGGTGLNLTGADTVVHFDPWWNPAVESQATDRAHRIGQTRVVTSYRLICADTVEERVLQLQEVKRALLADVFEASDAAADRLSLADLRSLLGSGTPAGSEAATGTTTSHG
jgi:superfamily II DNA or RNA helicase